MKIFFSRPTTVVLKKPLLLLMAFLLSIFTIAFAQNMDTTITSSRADAIRFIESIKELKPSTWWPNVKPSLLLQDIKGNIYEPLSLYEGSNTNFCSYAALSYMPLHDDPMGFAKFVLELYKNGKANYNKILFNPSDKIRQAAGKLQFKGTLDIRPAEQMWFLCLANRFKGYVNIFNHNYDPGDENSFWASTNYGKFNRMITKIFNYRITARGSDLMHPWIKDLYSYISEKMKSGITILYLNNRYLRKKNHNKMKLGIPTHYVILLSFSRAANGMINMVYWDYGFRTLRQLTDAAFKKIIFGVTHCTKKMSTDE